MTPSLLERIQSQYPTMTASHKKIAAYLRQHYDKAVFLTAKQLGQTLNVSESTVLRFAVLLNYDGYPQLQKAMQDLVKNKITTVERHQLSLQHQTDNQLYTVLTSDINNIVATRTEVTAAAFDQAVTAIIEARSIFIISLRSTTALGHFLYFYLQLLLKNCRLVNSTGTFFEELRSSGPEDLVIGISFPRYTRQTVEGVQFAKEHGARVLSITDAITSPLVCHSDLVLTAQSEQISFLDSLVGPLSLINALILSVGTKAGENTAQALRELEAAWDAYHIYHREN